MSIFRNFIFIIKISLIAILYCHNSFAKPLVTVNKIQFQNNNKVIINLSQESNFKTFTLNKPERLVIDINNAKLGKQPKLPNFVKSFRSSLSKEKLRLVFDLKQQIKITKTNLDQSKKKKTSKIIIDFSGIKVKKAQKNQDPGDFILNKVEEFEISTKKVKNADGSSKFIVKKTTKRKKRMPIIVIDSGHGGKDPGAIGRFARTKEKNITLSYAKELGRQLIRTKRYKVYLTRDKDIFIPLRKRVAIARRKKADLFISLHANTISSSKTSGFSIYTLSEKSSDKQAARLARKENRADIINGVNFSGASNDIMKTLIDLSQRESMNNSSSFAAMSVKSMKNSGINILQNSHRFAGFAVLTAPDMISVLVELGYLSNKKEEKLLNSVRYKRKVAKNLVRAINEYFAKNKIN